MSGGTRTAHQRRVREVHSALAAALDDVAIEDALPALAVLVSQIIRQATHGEGEGGREAEVALFETTLRALLKLDQQAARGRR